MRMREGLITAREALSEGYAASFSRFRPWLPDSAGFLGMHGLLAACRDGPTRVEAKTIRWPAPPPAAGSTLAHPHLHADLGDQIREDLGEVLGAIVRPQEASLAQQAFGARIGHVVH